MLGALALTRLRVILLPRETRLLPALIHSVDEVFPQIGVQLLCALLVRALSLGDVLSEIRLAGLFLES